MDNEEFNNLVEFEPIDKSDDEDKNLNNFIEEIKGDIFKGAYFFIKKDGKGYFGCTEENKLKQERLLYKLREIIELYVRTYPDIDELREMAEINGEDPEKYVKEVFEGDDE